jgi:hypothetical protein
MFLQYKPTGQRNIGRPELRCTDDIHCRWNIPKVYHLEEDEVVVMVAAVDMIFCLTFCFKKNLEFFSLRKNPPLTVTQNRRTKLCIFGTLF